MIYGLGWRTQLAPATRRVLFTVYAPAGISALAVETHLQHIHDNVLRVAPESEITALNVYTAPSY